MSETEQLLYDTYEQGGQYAVYDLVKERFPNWEWSPCEPCEDDTPTWRDVCAVCWTQKEAA